MSEGRSLIQLFAVHHYEAGRSRAGVRLMRELILRLHYSQKYSVLKVAHLLEMSYIYVWTIVDESR